MQRKTGEVVGGLRWLGILSPAKRLDGPPPKSATNKGRPKPHPEDEPGEIKPQKRATAKASSKTGKPVPYTNGWKAPLAFLPIFELLKARQSYWLEGAGAEPMREQSTQAEWVVEVEEVTDRGAKLVLLNPLTEHGPYLFNAESGDLLNGAASCQCIHGMQTGAKPKDTENHVPAELLAAVARAIVKEPKEEPAQATPAAQTKSAVEVEDLIDQLRKVDPNGEKPLEGGLLKAWASHAVALGYGGKISESIEELSVVLGVQERLDLADALAAVGDAEKALEVEKKAFMDALKKRQGELEKKTERIARWLKNRAMEKEVRVIEVINQRRKGGVVQRVRTDTWRVIEERPADMAELGGRFYAEDDPSAPFEDLAGAREEDALDQEPSAPPARKLPPPPPSEDEKKREQQTALEQQADAILENAGAGHLVEKQPKHLPADEVAPTAGKREAPAAPAGRTAREKEEPVQLGLLQGDALAATPAPRVLCARPGCNHGTADHAAKKPRPCKALDCNCSSFVPPPEPKRGPSGGAPLPETEEGEGEEVEEAPMRAAATGAGLDVESLAPQVLGWCHEAKSGLTEQGIAINRGLGYDKAAAVLQHLRERGLLSLNGKGRYLPTAKGRQQFEPKKTEGTEPDPYEVDVLTWCAHYSGGQGLTVYDISRGYGPHAVQVDVKQVERVVASMVARGLLWKAKGSQYRPTGLGKKLLEAKTPAAGVKADCPSKSPATKIWCTLPARHDDKHAAHYRGVPTFWDDPAKEVKTEKPQREFHALDKAFKDVDAEALCREYYGPDAPSRPGEVYRYFCEMKGTTRLCEGCDEATAPRAWVSPERKSYSSKKAKTENGSSSFGISVCRKCCSVEGIRAAEQRRYKMYREERAALEEKRLAKEAAPSEPSADVERRQGAIPLGFDDLSISWGEGWGDAKGKRVFWLQRPAGKTIQPWGVFWMDEEGKLICATQEGSSGSMPEKGWRQVTRAHHLPKLAELPLTTWQRIQQLGAEGLLPGQQLDEPAAASSTAVSLQVPPANAWKLSLGEHGPRKGWMLATDIREAQLAQLTECWVWLQGPSIEEWMGPMRWSLEFEDLEPDTWKSRPGESTDDVWSFFPKGMEDAIHYIMGPLTRQGDEKASVMFEQPLVVEGLPPGFTFTYGTGVEGDSEVWILEKGIRVVGPLWYSRSKHRVLEIKPRKGHPEQAFTEWTILRASPQPQQKIMEAMTAIIRERLKAPAQIEQIGLSTPGSADAKAFDDNGRKRTA